jgi:hypothetical protein
MRVAKTKTSARSAARAGHVINAHVATTPTGAIPRRILGGVANPRMTAPQAGRPAARVAVTAALVLVVAGMTVIRVAAPAQVVAVMVGSVLVVAVTEVRGIRATTAPVRVVTVVLVVAGTIVIRVAAPVTVTAGLVQAAAVTEVRGIRATTAPVVATTVVKARGNARDLLNAGESGISAQTVSVIAHKPVVGQAKRQHFRTSGATLLGLPWTCRDG